MSWHTMVLSEADPNHKGFIRNCRYRNVRYRLGMAKSRCKWK